MGLMWMKILYLLALVAKSNGKATTTQTVNEKKKLCNFWDESITFLCSTHVMLQYTLFHSSFTRQSWWKFWDMKILFVFFLGVARQHVCVYHPHEYKVIFSTMLRAVVLCDCVQFFCFLLDVVCIWYFS